MLERGERACFANRSFPAEEFYVYEAYFVKKLVKLIIIIYHKKFQVTYII